MPTPEETAAIRSAPSLKAATAQHPPVVAAESAYEAACDALDAFDRINPVNQARFNEARTLYEQGRGPLVAAVNRAAAHLTACCNEVANCRFGAPSAPHEVTNTRLKQRPNWLKELAAE